MKNIIRTSLVAASFVLVTSTYATPSPAAGYVDFSSFAPNAEGQLVEIKIESGLIRFAAKIAALKEPAAAELLKNIQQVRVNVVELDDTNRADAAGKIAAVRGHLESMGWAPTVNVRDPKKGEDVAVYIKSKDDDSIDGIVVTVIEKGKQAVFVNVVGNIQPEQLAELGDRLNISALDRLEIKTARFARNEK